jgi:tRNA A37 threonylcarbamoyladenosine dehydratase
MENAFSRTQLLIGREGLEILARARVAVFGLGGVGGHLAEALARAGIGALHLVDHDTVNESNLNRQIFATRDTIGQYKTDAAAERIARINPACRVTLSRAFFLPENAEETEFCAFDYVADAIDTVSGKLAIVEKAREAGVPVISAMGAGNKLNAATFEVADISQTSVCPLARVMRRELKKRGIKRLKVVYSKEEPRGLVGEESGKRIAGSISFVPSVAGLIMAGEIVNDLLRKGGVHGNF